MDFKREQRCPAVCSSFFNSVVASLLSPRWLFPDWNVGGQTHTHLASSVCRLVAEVVSALALKAGRGIIQQMGTRRVSFHVSHAIGTEL